MSQAFFKNFASSFIEEGPQQLLPGIPDEITLRHVAPKLPWKAFHALSAVSRSWQQEIGSRRVYDTRVLSKSLTSLVVVNHFRVEDVRAIGLYSVQEQSFCQLPLIPGQMAGLPRSSQCIALNGKIYVLGGKDDDRTVQQSSSSVYVMDVAGQKQWKRCASMEYGRQDFGCGVLNGKIYVCGGKSADRPVLVPEVYDPELDSWSPIKPMLSMRIGHKVTALRSDEFFVEGGEIYNPDYDGTEYDEALNAAFGEIYNAVWDEWRKVDSLGNQGEILFMADGKTHLHDCTGVSVHNIDEQVSEACQPFSFFKIKPDLAAPHCPNQIVPWTTLAVGNKLVTVLRQYYGYKRRTRDALFIGTGFNSDTAGMWRKVDYRFQLGKHPLICAIQL